MKKIYSYFVMSLFSVLLLSAAPSTGLYFSGASTSFIDLGSTATAPALFTIEAWVRYSSFPSGESAYILSTEEDNAGSKGFSLRANANKINLCIGNGGWVNVVGATALSTNTWYHITATCSATNINVYVNGILDATAPLAAPMVPSSKNLRIGDGPSWTGRLFNGVMADLRFWNVVRSQAEITADMTSTLSGSESGLVAGWKMNEGTGTAVADVKATYPIAKPTDVSWFYPVTGITVSGNSITTDGGTSQMTATVLPVTAMQNLTWTVSDPKIATINPNGLLSARKNGEVTVTATAKDGSNVAGSVQIMVSNQIIPAKQVFIDFGQSTGPTPAATADTYGNYWNNATDFATTAAAVALVDNTKASTGFNLYVTTAFAGNNGPAGGGLTTPNASYLGEFAITTATQDYFHATAGALKITGLNVNKGYRFKFFGSRDNTETRKSQFVLTGSNSVTTPELQTSGTNVGGAGINGNNSNILRSELVYPTAAGEITIAVNKTAGSFAHLSIMKIEEYNTNVTSITVSGDAISTFAGTSQMTATVLPATATQTVTWSVNDPSIATISPTGLLTARKNGTVTVTATSNDGLNVIGSAQIVISNQPVPTKQVLIDFGPASQTTLSKLTVSPTGSNYWNNYTGDAANATTATPLVDKVTGLSTGIKITTLAPFSVNANPGAPGLDVTNSSAIGDLSVPNATLDYFFMTSGTPGLKFTGLSANKGYKFSVFGCRIATDTRVSQYTFTGSTTTVGTLQTSGANLGGAGIHGNNSNLYITPMLYADANGEIKLEMSIISGGFAYLNALKIEEYNVNVTAINVTGASISTNAGTSQMTATVLPANATEKGVTWSVDDELIATIDANGLLTAKTNGTVKVTATTKEAGSTVSSTIDVVVSGQSTTGMNNSDAGIKVFPVVSDNQVAVKGATYIVELFNSTGVKVAAKVASAETIINTSNLPKGIYVLVVDKKQSYKLVR